MDFELTEEQRDIQLAAREFAKGAFEKEKILELEKAHAFPREIWQKAGRLGFLGIHFPEEYGGQNYGTFENILVVEEFCRRDSGVGIALSLADFSSEVVLRFGTEEQKRKVLLPVARGESISGGCYTEPDHGSDITFLSTTAVRRGGAFVINGTKTFITTGKNSDITVVTAYTDRARKHRGISAFVVEKGTPGFSVGKTEEKMGLRASDTVELIFEECTIPRENLLGNEGDGFVIAMASLDGGRIGIASQSVGLGQACLEASVSYARERIQFNKPIGQFQGIRWMIADMATRLEAARLLTFNAAAMRDRGENFSMAASMAKVFASEMANKVAYQALQIHGGYGYMKDFPVERYYRDARVFTLYEGTSEIQRKVISDVILGK